MSEKDLGKALLRGEEPIDLQALTDHVLRRDRRRMWLLGIACVIAWMLVVMLPWATTLPMLEKVVKHQSEINGNTSPIASDQQAESIRMLQAVRAATIATFISSVISMFVAAVCTVLLITLSRRATLRHVNASLREISIQIKALPGGLR